MEGIFREDPTLGAINLSGMIPGVILVLSPPPKVGTESLSSTAPPLRGDPIDWRSSQSPHRQFPRGAFLPQKLSFY